MDLYNMILAQKTAGGGGGSSSNYASGTFTSPAVADGVISVDVGFQPDAVVAFFEIGTNKPTMAWYIRNTPNVGYDSMGWELKPHENVTYINNANETGVKSLTETGFTFKAHGGNTTNKTVTFYATKGGNE